MSTAVLTPIHPVSPGAETLPVPESGALYRLSVDQYQAMIDHDVFGEDRVELLEGLLVQKMTINPPHRLVLDRLRHILEPMLPQSTSLFIQAPITLLDSHPEPDLAIVTGSFEDYPDRHPSAVEVLMVIEIADTSLKTDRGPKQKIYAASGIYEYWIADLINHQVDVLTDPVAEDQPHYATVRSYRPGESVPFALSGQKIAEIPVSSVLP